MPFRDRPWRRVADVVVAAVAGLWIIGGLLSDDTSSIIGGAVALALWVGRVAVEAWRAKRSGRPAQAA